MKPLIFCIDFDGTCVTHEYPNVGKDVGAVPVLKRLVDAGHNLILWTVRSGDGLLQAEKWFEENDLPLYGSNKNPGQSTWSKSPKAHANAFIDDAALGCPLIEDDYSIRPYVNWKEVEKILEQKGVI